MLPERIGGRSEGSAWRPLQIHLLGIKSWGFANQVLALDDDGVVVTSIISGLGPWTRPNFAAPALDLISTCGVLRAVTACASTPWSVFGL